jgi:hypothetical protein
MKLDGTGVLLMDDDVRIRVLYKCFRVLYQNPRNVKKSNSCQFSKKKEKLLKSIRSNGAQAAQFHHWQQEQASRSASNSRPNGS